MTSDYATLMVHLDARDTDTARLEAVGGLAASLGAGLIGITASEHLPALYFEMGAVAEDVLEEDRKRLRGLMAAAEARFRAAVCSQPAPVQWRAALAMPADFVAREARAADLIVALPHRQTALGDPTGGVDPGALVLKAGRPVLVIPEGAAWTGAERMMIAWKDCREARRAVSDALPLLKRASAVSLASVLESYDEREVVEARLADVAAWLKRHGVTATIAALDSDGGPVETLDRHARDFDAGIVVAGAYGHSRLGEWIFGGVTHHLLAKAGHPALLAH